MEIALYLIVVCALCLAGFFVYKETHPNDKKDVSIVKPTSFYTESSMQATFKESYMWACETFGVRKNVYDELEGQLSLYSNLGVPYFTYYRVCNYPRDYYPNIAKVDSWVTYYDNERQHKEFVKEFVTLVNKLRTRVDEEEVNLFKKYEIPFKHLLTAEFKVDTMKLHSLPNE